MADRAAMMQRLAEAKARSGRADRATSPGLGMPALPTLDDLARLPPRELRAQGIGPDQPTTWREKLANLIAGGQQRGSGTLARPLAEALTGTGYGQFDAGSAVLPNPKGESSFSPLDVLPGASELLSLAEGSEAAQKGDWTGAALGAMGGVMPGVGKAGKGAVKALAKGGRGALAEVAKIAPKVDATVGDIKNAPAMFEGISPHEFTGTEQWHRFGQAHGVPNLGSASEADWQASLSPFTTSKGQEFTVPGGVGTKEPFTYYDLLHLKQQGINPNDIPPELHQGIHDRMLATMSPEGEVTPERMMNQLLLAQISPNQPLTPNELAVGRSMVKGPEDLKRLGEMVPWRYSDDPATTGARDIVGTQVNKKTGKTANVTRRQQLGTEIANKLGLGASSTTGGLGARGTADYTRIAETAQRMQDDPEFFRFRGAGEGGGADPHDPNNWSNFVERLANQTPGLSSKTGSFGAVWQNPAKANISAVDRHMAGKFDEEMFGSPEAYEQFKTDAFARYKKTNPDSPAASYDDLTKTAKTDLMFGYLNNNPGMKYRMKAEKGSNSGVGPVNPNVPEHLQPDQAQWIHEPEDIELISDPYRRVLDANAEAANASGQSIFGSQWMLWDRIRNRLEPHEIMFPGLEKIPRMSMDQMHRARADLSAAGYMGGTEEVLPVKPLPSASRAAYFSLPLAGVAGGGGMLEMLQERERQRQGGQT